VYFYSCTFNYSHRWEDNIKIVIQEVSWERGAMDWIDLARNMDGWWALANSVLNLQVPQYLGNFLTS